MKKKTPFGRPLKSPELGPRVPLCIRVPEATKRKIRAAARKAGCSQSDVVVDAVSRLP